MELGILTISRALLQFVSKQVKRSAIFIIFSSFQKFEKSKTIEPFGLRRCLKMLTTHTHTYEQTTEAYLFYKLTNELKGSGELKNLHDESYLCPCVAL